MDSHKYDDVANKIERSSTSSSGGTFRISVSRPSHRGSSVIGSKVHKIASPKARKPSKPPKSPRQKIGNPPVPSLIHVYVNNRLGGRFDIMCSPTDSIGDFKKIVAVYSGTKAEAILLKRQGMRPYSDKLTLEDYEIGNGSSLDMEIDTGD